MGNSSHHQALLRRAYQSQIQLKLSNTMNIATPWFPNLTNPSSAATPLFKKHCNVGLTDRTFSRLKQQVLVQTWQILGT